MRPAGFITLVVSLVPLVACGGAARDARPTTSFAASDAPSAARPISTIELDPTAPASSLQTSLAVVARDTPAADGDCMLVWGDVGTIPEPARWARITWRARESLDVVLLCGDALEAKMRDPRVRQVAMLGWRNGALLGSHPSDTSVETPIDTADVAMQRAMASQPAIGLFVPATTGPDARAPIGPIMEELRKLPRLFLFAMLAIR